MKHGLKVGPQKRAYEDIGSCRPQFVEVWYNATKPDEYTDLFAFMDAHGTEAALHFWATTKDGLFPSLTADDPALIGESMDLMRSAIDTAAKNGHVYVNIHPGPRARVELDFTNMVFTTKSAPTDIPISERILIENAQSLTSYAKARNVVFTVETVPPRVALKMNPDGSYDRSETVAIHEAPLSVMASAAAAGITIANDFGHTAAAVLPQTREAMNQGLYDVTKILAPHTRLIHLGFVIPPYNGSDVHDQLTHPVFQTADAVPNESHMSELLMMFKNRPDVWSLIEPNANHAGNYRYGLSMLENLGLLT